MTKPLSTPTVCENCGKTEAEHEIVAGWDKHGDDSGGLVYVCPTSTFTPSYKWAQIVVDLNER